MGEMHGGGINSSCSQEISKQMRESICMQREIGDICSMMKLPSKSAVRMI